MPRILNKTERPYNLGIAYSDNNNVLQNKPFHLIPGEAKEVSDKDLKQLKKQKGFKRYVEKGFLVVLGKGEEEPKGKEEKQGVNISPTAKKLAEDNGIDLDSLEPNDNGNVTVAMVEKAIAEAKEAEVVEENDDSEDVEDEDDEL